ncbi:helicase-related protein [Paenibacillus sp. NFR01]|uniref:helicase-related protein n=1 Tax=Paenibacillus sp. NFR01 TaxID=1566279 RepID=UPI0008D1BAD1|nr:helicase-related protein [Paenibacillus sp. NFR01]SEU14073.1 Superfamily II DNA/RNA helicase required for DNA uptake (late competence protein) [Paenibacillus sp. NFR01]
MKVAVYAVCWKKEWQIKISLDIQVDKLWWRQRVTECEEKGPTDMACMLRLAGALPLGWAVKLERGFSSEDGMHRWGLSDWKGYIRRILRKELEKEWTARQKIKSGVVSGGEGSYGDEREWKDHMLFGTELMPGHEKQMQLSRLAALSDTLSAALGGRSLLVPELEALLAEQAPECLGEWLSIVQLAYLQGRLMLEAAAGSSAASGFRPGSGRKKGRGRVARGGKARGALAAAPRLLRAAALRLPPLLWRGAAASRAGFRCLRCGSGTTARTPCAACGLAGCAYCEACLALGRSRACALLVRSAALPAVACTAGGGPTVAARRWGLSAAQAGAAGAALGFLAELAQRSANNSRPEKFLLWAVTGAGKTEITFPLLEAALAAGGRALVATPRRDVVLELAPRLRKAFPAHTLAVLYGGSAERWEQSQITLATTHQLMRFYRSFDLVILDELDAFPYHGDPMLAYAAEEACKPDGAFLLLSATPPKGLQREAARGKLPHAKVPVRFHGQRLPVPLRFTLPAVRTLLAQGRLSNVLTKQLMKSIRRDAQIFLFVARISQIEGLLRLLKTALPGVAIEGTSSRDPQRTEKVAAFRAREITLLVTTTILERGVTVPRSDVYILDADDQQFDEASLIQMAGRAGRSKTDPNGLVAFFAPRFTGAQRSAIRQIRSMNAIARKQGYFVREAPK